MYREACVWFLSRCRCPARPHKHTPCFSIEAHVWILNASAGKQKAGMGSVSLVACRREALLNTARVWVHAVVSELGVFIMRCFDEVFVESGTN